MKKVTTVFISQPTSGLNVEQITKDKARVEGYLIHAGYDPGTVVICGPVYTEPLPEDANPTIWYLGEAIKALAEADIVIFAKGWEDSHSCTIVLQCAEEHRIPYIFEEDCN